MSPSSQELAGPPVKAPTRKERTCANCGHAEQGSLGKHSEKDRQGRPYGCSHYDEFDNICGCQDWRPAR
jgi:hypothetical protein